jgi:hypothetical protein
MGSQRDAREEHVHVSVVEAGHDEAVLEIVGYEAVLFGLGFDFIVASYDSEEARRRDDEGFGPWVLGVDGEDAAVDVGCAGVRWFLGCG